MKFIKKFENRHERKTKYKYLDKEDNEKIKNFIINFIDSIDIDNKIDKLTYENFNEATFDYADVFEYMLTTNFYTKNNIFYEVDTYCKNNNINVNVIKLRNCMFDILSDIKKTLKIDSKLDKKLINILEQKPQKYKNIFNLIGDYLNSNVKDACKWMLDYRKYNI